MMLIEAQPSKGLKAAENSSHRFTA